MISHLRDWPFESCTQAYTSLPVGHFNLRAFIGKHERALISERTLDKKLLLNVD